MWTYSNPVQDRVRRRVRSAKVADQIGGRRYALVTYDHADRSRRMAAQTRRRRRARRSSPSTTSTPIRTSRISCRPASTFGTAQPAPEVIVALGGGSMIDAAKVLAASGGDFENVRRHLIGEGAARCDGPFTADHRDPDDLRHRQRSHLLGNRVGRGQRQQIFARPSASLPGSRDRRSAADARRAARADACHRPRRAVARARKHLERQRQSGLGEFRRRGGARDHRDAAAAARRSSTISICARARRAPA